MKTKFVFISLLLLATFLNSFAQDSTSIKITLPQTEEWKVEEVKMSYLPPVFRENYIDFHFEEVDSKENSWFAKIDKSNSGNYFFNIDDRIGFNLLVLPNDDIEISFDEEQKPTFLKGKTAKENQITYDWNTNYFRSFASWANEDSITFISKLDSMTKKVLL